MAEVTSPNLVWFFAFVPLVYLSIFVIKHMSKTDWGEKGIWAALPIIIRIGTMDRTLETGADAEVSVYVPFPGQVVMGCMTKLAKYKSVCPSQRTASDTKVVDPPGCE